MSLGPLEYLVLLLGVLAMLGPVLAGVFLAVRLNKTQRSGSSR